MHRKTDYTDDLATSICERVATSSNGLARICEENPGFPSPQTVYRWLWSHETFREMYTRAKAEQAQVLADEIVDIADTTQMGEIVTIKTDGTEERKLADMLEHRKLRIEARKWVAAKLLPKKYGDKIQQEVTGKDGNALEVTVRRVGD